MKKTFTIALLTASMIPGAHAVEVLPSYKKLTEATMEVKDANATVADKVFNGLQAPFAEPTTLHSTSELRYAVVEYSLLAFVGGMIWDRSRSNAGQDMIVGGKGPGYNANRKRRSI